MKTINLEEVKKFVKLKTNINFSNDIYINGNKLYKIYNNYYELYAKNLEVRKNFIEYLINLKEVEGCVIPKGMIYSKNQFVGIFMKYYKNYFNLYNLLCNEINVAVKIKILKRISMNLKNIHGKGIVHGDIHLGNIITDLDDAKFIDLDEAYFIFDDDQYDMRLDIRNLLTVILSVIYSFDLELLMSVELKTRKKNIVDFLNKTGLNTVFKDYIKNIYFTEDFALDYYLNFIENFDLEQIEYDNKRLKKLRIKK